MEIRKTAAIFLAAAFLPALVSGCAGKSAPSAGTPQEAPVEAVSPADEPGDVGTVETETDEPEAGEMEIKEYTLEDALKCVSPEYILSRYDSFSFSQFTYDNEDNQTDSVEYLFGKTPAGVRQYGHMEAGGLAFDWEYSIADGVPGAYYYKNGVVNGMAFVPSSEYESLALMELIAKTDEEEEFIDCSMQDGIAIVTSKVCHDYDGSYDLYHYRIIPETDDAMVMDIESFDEDGALTYHRVCSFSYDCGYEPDIDVTKDMIDTEEASAFTLVINPGQADEEIQEFHIATGVLLDFTSQREYHFYADEACTQEVDELGQMKGGLTAYVVCE